MRQYSDNTLIKESTSAIPLRNVDNDQSLKFGVQITSTNSNFFFGNMDQIRIYRRALKDSEIRMLYRTMK